VQSPKYRRQIQHPEYCQGDCTGKVNQCVGVAPRRSPASLDAVRSQPEVDTRDDDDDDEQKVEVGQCARRVTNLCHCAESAAATPSGVRKASRAGSQTACLIKAGTLLNIWLYFHHGTHA
jgi:hypothetical protein